MYLQAEDSLHYRIYIDETGNFSKKTPVKSNTDFVAGWVSRDLPEIPLDRLIRTALQCVNAKLPEGVASPDRLVIPKHLHFFPLHLPHLRSGSDSAIRFPIGLVPEAVRAVFKAIRPHTFLTFRSRGFPHFYTNEQGAYADILRATILQIIDRLHYLPEDFIEVFIAARRIKELVGEFGFKDPDAYEQQFCGSLSKEIKSVFQRRKIRKPIAVSVRNGKRDVGLAVADFVCGACRWTKEDYLQELPTGSAIDLNIHNAFVYISKRRISRIIDLYETDPAQGLLQAFCHYAEKPFDHEISVLTDQLIKKCDCAAIQLFAAQLATYLQNQIVENPFRYQCLNSAEKLLNCIEPRILSDSVQAVVKSYRIRLTGHRGDIQMGTVNGYLEFLDQRGPDVLGSRYLTAQERVEAVLTAVQPAAFNRFKFEDVENYLLDEYRRYLATFPESHSGVDETLARLEGTIGQMFGFLCDFPGQGGYFDEALRHLKSDISRCRKNSPFWRQGMGYLTTLLFKQNDFEHAANYFLQETSHEGTPPPLILDLAQTAAFNCEQDDFFQLHRLYLCALALKKGMKVSGEDRIKEKLMVLESPDGYPRFQSLKWLGVIFALKGDLRTAIELFTAGIGGREQGFTIEVIKLPLKILLHWARLTIGEKSDLDLPQQLEKLEKTEPGIRETLTRLNIDKFHSWDNSWDPYRIAALMPFYFA